MKPSARRGMSRKSHARKFRKGVKRTKAANLLPARGGFRL